jgi:hypothetical protein
MILKVKDKNGKISDIPALRGPQGPQGDPGYTPQKGIDYFTAADKAAMVNEVIAALPKYAGGVS